VTCRNIQHEGNGLILYRKQIGTSLRGFGALRRRRNALEYPLYPTERASAGEAAEALETADEIIDAVA
jgi:hypothetical protein